MGRARTGGGSLARHETKPLQAEAHRISVLTGPRRRTDCGVTSAPRAPGEERVAIHRTGALPCKETRQRSPSRFTALHTQS